MRFTDYGDTITDAETGLEWTKAETKLPWQAGLDWCAALRTGWHDDWRMPTIQEWVAVLDYTRYEPAADPMLGLRAASIYWSASTSALYPSLAWYVRTFYGYADSSNKTDDLYVRAVRAGSRPFGHLPDDAPVTQAQLRAALAESPEALRQAEARRDAAEGVLATLRDEVAYLKSQIAKVRAVVK